MDDKKEFRKLSWGGGNSPEFTSPFDEIAEIIKVATGTVDNRGNSLTFPSNSGTTRIDLHSVHATTVDGQEVSNMILPGIHSYSNRRSPIPLCLLPKTCPATRNRTFGQSDPHEIPRPQTFSP
jgi:hypothetical protein